MMTMMTMARSWLTVKVTSASNRGLVINLEILAVDDDYDQSYFKTWILYQWNILMTGWPWCEWPVVPQMALVTLMIEKLKLVNVMLVNIRDITWVTLALVKLTKMLDTTNSTIITVLFQTGPRRYCAVCIVRIKVSRQYSAQCLVHFKDPDRS